MYRIFIIGHINQRAAAARQQNATVVLHHLRQARNKHFVMGAEQALRTQNGKAGIGVRLGQQMNDLFAGRLAAGKFIGETLRAEIFLHIAMMVIIEIERRGGDMNEITHAPGNGPLSETAGSPHVSEIKSLLCTPGRGKA